MTLGFATHSSLVLVLFSFLTVVEKAMSSKQGIACCYGYAIGEGFRTEDLHLVLSNVNRPSRKSENSRP